MPAPPELVALQGFLSGALRGQEEIASTPEVATRAREFVAGNDRVPPEEQADIYRSQFWLRHHEALAEDYPGLIKLIGADTFEALARAYLEAHPPRTPSLRDLAADLQAFAARWDGFPEDLRAPALELLRYEQALLDLFDAAEPPPLDPRKLQGMPEDAWETARIVVSPLLMRLRFDHPVHRYLIEARDSEDASPAPPPREPVLLALYRQDFVTRFEDLDPAAFALLDALAEGQPLVAACDKVAASLPAAEAEALGPKVGEWFQRWTMLRWIVDVIPA